MSRGLPRVIFSRAVWTALAGLAFTAEASLSPVRADFRTCNETANPLALAIAHSDGLQWVSEGWWTIESHKCATILIGPLKARYYYLHAVQFKPDGTYDGGWIGDRYFCTTRRSFTITSRDECATRGYDRTGFFEVDTQDAVDYVHVLTERKGS
jgi:uncharacterized membrane protein